MKNKILISWLMFFNSVWALSAEQITDPFSKLSQGAGDSPLTTLLQALLNGILKLAPFVIVPMFIYAGFMLVTAVGNADKIKKAKSMLWYAILGTALILGAHVIMTMLQGTFEELL